MLTIANTIQEATSASGILRAGGTDYMERRRQRLVDGDIVDILGIGGIDQISTSENGGMEIGGLVKIADVAQSAQIQQDYAGLAEAAGRLGTPQIRLVGTVGGNLTQVTRCQYYRHPHLSCTKKGDAVCGGREGYHPNGVIFDNGGCAHPHPSTLGMALMAYDAEVEINGSETRPIATLYGDGSDHNRDHLLTEGEMVTRIFLPASNGEKGSYFRASQRALAEWATIECTVRLGVEGETIQSAAVAVGAVAPVPLRLPNVEAALVGKAISEETFAEAASLAADGAKPLRDTGYKVQMLVHSVEETLLQAVGMN